MYHVGIVVVAYKLEDDAFDRFMLGINESAGELDVLVKVIDDEHDIGYDLPNGEHHMNKSKGLNIGIKECIDNDCEVIICADVDVLTPPNLIKFTYDTVKSNNCCFHAVVRNIDPEHVQFDYNALPFNDWLKLPLRESSRGCWNGMTAEMWKKSGGYNEELYGWGYEDLEFHERLTSKSITLHRETQFPLVHVNHPWRKQLRRNDDNRQIAKSRDWTNYDWLYPNNTKKLIHLTKPTILCTSETAMGMGDGVMLLPTIRELAKKYTVKVICSWPSYSIVNKIGDGHNIIVHNMNDQGHFYDNDHIKAYNLIYWNVNNTLRGLGHHALNMIRKCAELPIINNEMLDDIPIINYEEEQMRKFLNSLKRPIIVTQPFVSYWNKMIDSQKHLRIVNELRKIGSVVQIGGGVPDHFIHKHCTNLVGQTNIDQSLAILKHCDIFVGYDSFLQHAAAALKTPSVVMFCGTSPEDFGYPFHRNIWHPEIAFCQKKCARPMRWLYDYSYENPDDWNSRHESGWVCPYKLCDLAITEDEVINAVIEELKIGRDRDWTFRDYTEEDYEDLFHNRHP